MTPDPGSPDSDPPPDDSGDGTPTAAEAAADTNAETSQLQPLRTIPAVILLLGMLGTKLLPVVFEDGPMLFWMAAAFGPLVLGVLLLFWWVTISRASGPERLIGLVGVLSAFGLTWLVMHPTMVFRGIVLVTGPMGLGAFGIAAVLLSRVRSVNRAFLIVLVSAVSFSYSTLVRSKGMWGDFGVHLEWRWVVSSEDRLLADRDSRDVTNMAEFSESEVTAWLANPEWPSFRGGDRSGAQHDSVISDDWEQQPPQQLWKIPIGPGWSSFAVAGKLLMTQEQRGDDESIVCYHADTGQEIWHQQVVSRFSDPMGGPGPRATPTLADDGVFVQGANGQILRLDARSGKIIWEQDLRQLADRQPPEWGFSSSPLVTGDLVVVWGGGTGNRGIFALNRQTGDEVWSAAAGDHSYSSPQLCEVYGTQRIAMLTNDGICLLDPATGEEQFRYDWSNGQYRALQPHIIDGRSLLLPTGMGDGTRRIDLTETDGRLQATEAWTTRRLKTDFNDFVVHNGFAWGFDGAVVCCIDLNSGQQKWKRGRYGKGQILLLQSSGLLLVLGEHGDLILLKADPDKHQELAKIPALEGKTWNHPVLIGDRLYIRNSQEAGCWKLPLVESDATRTEQR